MNGGRGLILGGITYKDVDQELSEEFNKSK